MFKLFVLMSVLALSYGAPQFIGFLPQFQGGVQPLTFNFPFAAPPTTTAAPTTTLAPTTLAPVAPAPAAPAPAQLFFPFHQLFPQQFPQAAAPQPITYSFNTGK